MDESATSRGNAARNHILDAAMDVASSEGLEGLTIGRLAQAVNMSKSGLFGHFGSKEDLQLATIEAAGEVFRRRVIDPIEHHEPGIWRLALLMAAWIDYIEDSVFRGGCFFAAASHEFDGRPGPVRERIAELTMWWRDLLAEEAATAQEQGELASNLNPHQLAFEFHGFVTEANWAKQLLDETEAFDQARRAVEDRLGQWATEQGLDKLLAQEG